MDVASSLCESNVGYSTARFIRRRRSGLRDVNGISTRGAARQEEKRFYGRILRHHRRSFATVINVSGKSASVKRQC